MTTINTSSLNIQSILKSYGSTSVQGVSTGNAEQPSGGRVGGTEMGRPGGGFAADVLNTLSQMGIGQSTASSDSDSASGNSADSTQALSAFMHDLFQALHSSNNVASTGGSDSGSGSSDPFADLAQALESGDLSAAQSAYATLQQNAPSNSSANSGSGSDPIASAMDAIGSALDSGDVQTAKDTFAALAQDMQSRGPQGPQGGPPPGPPPGGGMRQGGYQDLSSNLESLIQSLSSDSSSSSSTSTSGDSDSSDTLATLKKDYQNLVQSLGGASDSGNGSDLAGFLQNLSKNVQGSFGTSQHGILSAVA